MSVIMGVDPGSQRTGWGVIERQRNGAWKCLGHGVVNLKSGVTISARLARLNFEINKLISQYQPNSISIEKVFLGKNVMSAFQLGHSRGVVLAQAGVFELPVFEYATRSIKKMLTGTGAAEKEQVQFMVESILGIPVKGLDASDALALAIGHAQQAEVAEKLNSQRDSTGVAT